MYDFLTWAMPGFFLNAVPSAVFGAELARRAGRSVWQGVVACALLPWVGMLFFVRQPQGVSFASGYGYYCSAMLAIAGGMGILSIFPSWVMLQDRNGERVGVSAFGNWVLVVLMLAVSVVYILGSYAVAKGSFAGSLATAIVASSAAAVSYLATSVEHLFTRVRFGAIGVAKDLLNVPQQEAAPGPGLWIAVVAIVVAYLCAASVPIGLQLKELPEPSAGQSLPPGPQQFPGQPPFPGQPSFPGQQPPGHPQPPSAPTGFGQPPAAPWTQKGDVW